MFQDLALFPHLSVQDNVMYGLRRLDGPERKRRMREILESFQIAHLCGRSPREISGGEQQRVALARSLVTEPSVLLLDEPLSSLDPRTKVRIIEDLQRWNQTRRIPILYVTHDHGEVLAMGDRVIALEQGKIVAEGLPLDVVPAPPRAALAQPAGFENLFDATVLELREQEGTMVCQLTGTSIRPRGSAGAGSDRLGSVPRDPRRRDPRLVFAAGDPQRVQRDPRDGSNGSSASGRWWRPASAAVPNFASGWTRAPSSLAAWTSPRTSG